MSGPQTPKESRRKFITRIMLPLTGLIVPADSFLFKFFLWAKEKRRLLAPGTPRESLVNENPKAVDARNLPLTPLTDFGIMGLSDHTVDLSKWSLELSGQVRHPLRLSYNQLLELPSVERKVLLICPGFFVNQGLWKGVSIRRLLERAGSKPRLTHVTVQGPEGDYEKTERFPLADILSDQVFLAYQVNGVALPPKHGFPLRLVAEDYYGSVWVKYVSTVTFEKV